MAGLIERLSSYNIFNHLLPGIIFSVLAERLTSYQLIQDNILITLFICYFIGLSISRIGSLIIEPALKRMSFIKFESYEAFLEAKNVDTRIEVLSEANNMYRTFCSLFLVLGFLMLYELFSMLVNLPRDASVKILCLTLFILFAYSYRKQTAYISKLINKEVQKKF